MAQATLKQLVEGCPTGGARCDKGCETIHACAVWVSSLLVCICSGLCGVCVIGLDMTASYGYADVLCLCLLFWPLLLLQPQFPDRADVLDLIKRHPSWPGSGSSTPVAATAAAAAHAASPGQEVGTPAADSPPATDTEDGDSDSDSAGPAGVSDDAQDDMQHEVPAPAAAAPRSGRPRTYTVEEQEVMRELNLCNLANVLHTTLKTGAVRWRVKLSAEGLQKRSRELHGKLLPSLETVDVDLRVMRMAA